MKKSEAEQIFKEQSLTINEELFEYISDEKTLEALLVMGANPDQIDTSFDVPILSLAFTRYEIKPFKLLLKYGANPNVLSSTSSGKENIIFELIQLYPSNIRFLKFLLKHKVNMNATTRFGDTVLMRRLKSIPTHSKEIIELILNNGGDPNQSDKFGNNVFSLIKEGKITVNDDILTLLNRRKE